MTAPILLKLKLETPAKIIYLIYSFFCHQIHYRSLHIFDHQYAWCTRDTFIWFGLLFAGLFVRRYKVKGIKWYQVVLFVIPIALDGGIQLIATTIGMNNENAFYVSTNLSRMVTGGILGVGLGLWIFPALQFYDQNSKKENRKLFFVSGAFLRIFVLLFAFYIILVGIWDLTSEKYEPTNVLDSEVKLPKDSDEWFLRRKNAVCPANISDPNFIKFNCDNE